jgi:hypothetical protein
MLSPKSFQLIGGSQALFMFSASPLFSGISRPTDYFQIGHQRHGMMTNSLSAGDGGMRSGPHVWHQVSSFLIGTHPHLPQLPISLLILRQHRRVQDPQHVPRLLQHHAGRSFQFLLGSGGTHHFADVVGHVLQG